MSEPKNIYERHGMYGTPEYRSWYGMKSRCTNKRAHNYKDYGGRGISFCESWKYFSNFYRDMGSRPAGTTLDRIDNGADYSPENCRWATPKQQRLNQRVARSNKTGISGVYFDKPRQKWMAYIGSPGQRVTLYWGSDFLSACASRISAENKRRTNP